MRAEAPRREEHRARGSFVRVASAPLVADELALLERDHALAHLVDHLAVVRDHEDRRAGAVDAVEELHDPDGGVRVEVPGRLVADEERRVVDDRARDRDALLLAAGELVRDASSSCARGRRARAPPAPCAGSTSALALHLERVGDVLGALRFGSSLKSWKTQPTLRRSIGTFERLSRPRSRPPTMMRPLVGSSSFRSSRMIVDLPEPDAPTTKTNSPLSITNETSVERGDVGLVDLRHALEDDHRRRRSSASCAGSLPARRRRVRRGPSCCSSACESVSCTGVEGDAAARPRRLSARARVVAEIALRDEPYSACLRRPWRAGTRG